MDAIERNTHNKAENQIENVYKDLQGLKDMSNPYRFLGLKSK